MLDGPDKYMGKVRDIARAIRAFYKVAAEVDDETEIAARVRDEDVDLLVSLMSLGVLKANLFPILLRSHPAAAIEFLKCRYLARHIDYDEGVNGLTSDLSGYFDEIVSAMGESALHEILHSPGVDRKKLKDRRLREALAFALESIDSPAEASAWLDGPK